MKNNYPLPTKKQEIWADMEMGVIIHHLMDVYHPEIPNEKLKTSAEKMPADSFAPTDVNTDQWMSAATKMGAKYAILVTNHVTGFSLWPTKENNYSIASSPYKNGKADIVRDFINSCKKYGIQPGLYYSTGCNGYYGISDDVEHDYFSEKYQDYVRIVEQQLEELWGNYGELFEIWFDGGVVPHKNGGPDVVRLLNKYQPSAICFQGPEEHFQNLRWVGNERGVAPLDCWSTDVHNSCAFGGTEDNSSIGLGNPNGQFWIPAETDVGNRKQEACGGGWGWAPNEAHLAYTPKELLEKYLTSVGRNTNLLIGMGIDRNGHFEDEYQFEKFGELIKDIYADPVQSCRGIGSEFILDAGKPVKIRYLVMMEDIHYGERIRKFTVDIRADNEWEKLFEAHCIGHKRIIPLDREVKEVRLTIQESADVPIIKEMTIYR